MNDHIFLFGERFSHRKHALIQVSTSTTKNIPLTIHPVLNCDFQTPMLLANSWRNSDKYVPNWHMDTLILADCFLCLEHSSLEHTLAPALISFRFLFKHHLPPKYRNFFKLHLKKQKVSFPLSDSPYSFTPLYFSPNAHYHVIYIYIKFVCCLLH